MELDDFAIEYIFSEIKHDIDIYNKNTKKEIWVKLIASWRNKYEIFIYDILKQRYGAILDAFWKTYEIPLISDRAFVIVERRCHPNLWFILRNIAYFGRGWTIYLFCSKQNYEYCVAILGKNYKNVHLIVYYNEIADMITAIDDYNTTLKSKSFWEQIESETICVFQMDCYLRKHIPEELLEYDYVASPWIWDTKLPGGGGLSLRKRSVMIDICDKKEQSHVAEDDFVSRGVCELGYNFLHSSESKKYFVESCFTEDPVGVHQWWTFYFSNMPVSKEIIINYLTLDV
jgi:hypothetical protein